MEVMKRKAKAYDQLQADKKYAKNYFKLCAYPSGDTFATAWLIEAPSQDFLRFTPDDAYLVPRSL